MMTLRFVGCALFSMLGMAFFLAMVDSGVGQVQAMHRDHHVHQLEKSAELGASPEVLQVLHASATCVDHALSVRSEPMTTTWSQQRQTFWIPCVERPMEVLTEHGQDSTANDVRARLEPVQRYLETFFNDAIG